MSPEAALLDTSRAEVAFAADTLGALISAGALKALAEDLATLVKGGVASGDGEKAFLASMKEARARLNALVQETFGQDHAAPDAVFAMRARNLLAQAHAEIVTVFTLMRVIEAVSGTHHLRPGLEGIARCLERSEALDACQVIDFVRARDRAIA